MKISEMISECSIRDIKRFGIYKISVNYRSECYVGSTTRNFYSRWSQHLYCLKRGIHGNSRLQNIANKHGVGCFVFEILEVVADKEEVIPKEQKWIEYFDSHRNGFNGCPIAQNSTGKECSMETRSFFWKEVSQYSLDGDYMDTFQSLKEASKLTKTDYITICDVCRGKTKTANGFQWRYGSSKEGLPPTKVKKSNPIYKCNADGNVLEKFLSIKEASEVTGIKYRSIVYALKKNIPTGEFKWERLKNETNASN